MKIIKKLVVTPLLTALVISAAGCGSSGGTSQAVSDSVIPTVSPSSSAQSVSGSSASGTLSLPSSVDDPSGYTIAVDSAPTESMSDGDSYSDYIKLADYKGLDLAALQTDSQTTALDLGNTIKTPAIAAFQSVVNNSEVIKYPEQLLSAWHDNEVKVYTDAANEAGTDYNTYIDQLGITDAFIEDSAKSSCKSQLTARAIMQAENITEDSEIYQTALTAFKDTYNGKTPEETVSDGTLAQCEADSTFEIMAAELVIQSTAAS